MKLSLLPKSNLISIFFSKKVFLCLVVLCFVGSLFGAEYVWTGRGDGSTWTDKDNWGGSGYPGESDNATFSSGAEVTITSDITVNQIYLNASSKVTCDSNVTISLNSIITQGEFLNKGTLQKRENVSFIIKVEAGGKLINENKIICTDIEGLGNSNITNNGTIEASGAATFQSGANFTNADTSELSIGGAMTNVGTFSNSGGTVTVKGTTTNTGTIINTGDFTSEGAITNNNGGKITNNSSGTISGNINNSGGTVTNNGGTISDEVSGGTFEDNPIVVYSTIDSPDTVLDWNDASSWENGVKPDISGRDTAAIITLNGDVNISDFQDFFAAGNKNITLNGTGNLLYNGKKIYISQKSDTELNWNTTENWINGVVPIITGEGNQEVVIVLNSNFISSETLVFNNATGAAIHIYLCNKKLSANSVQLVSGWTHPDNNPAGNIHFYGPGTVETKILDASNNTDRTSTHRISLYDETIFKITEHAYADPARGEIIDTTGDCEVYLPASGFDMRVPSGKNDGATFVVVGTQAKAIEPQSYYKIELTSDISDTEKIFTFSRSETGKHNYDLNFPYVVYLMGDASWKLGDTELSDGFEGNVTIPSDNIESGTSQIEKTILLSSGTVESGDGIKVIFYTPCKNLVLNEFIYEKEIIYWTGDVSEDFSTPENWTFEDNPLTNLGDLTGKVVKIPSNCTNYPKLSSDISLEKLVVEDRAEVTIIDNGKLTVEKIHIYDSGALKAESGTVVFSGENPSYFAKYPEFSKFGTIEVASGTFNLNYPLSLTQLNIASGAIFSTSNELDISSIENSGDFSTTADLHITKSLTNNGTFQAEKVYLEPSENNITITGNSGDTEEFANNTKITELYCENQAEKNLVINNGISVEKIALSGIENASGKRLTVKYDKDNYSSGFIYLENNYDEAKYLFLADNSLVTIKNATITVYESDTQNIPASNFVEKGWRLGDPSEFIWIGKTDDWNDPTNWDYGTVPTPGKPVKIPTGLTNYPVLDTDINLIDETADIKEDSLIIEIGAEINFAGNNFSVTKFENFGKVEFKGGSISSTSINNSGTVILTGKEEISGEISESGTVIYSGTESDAKFSWGSNYKNLEIQDGFTGSFENGVIVSDSLKIENGFEITEKLDNSKNLLEISGTGTLSNKENISITSTGSQSFNGKINLSKILNITSDDKLTIATQSDFTNAGNILAVGVEVNATGVFTNEGKIDSSNADIRIESARFTNGAEKEIFSKNMSIDSGAVTNAGILTTTGDLVVNATGDFTSQGKVEVGSELNIKSQNCTVGNEISAGTILLEVSTFESTGNLSSTGELSITATLITNSGKIEAQNGELETTEANILFGENSENTFTGNLVVTTATDFENKGTIEVTSGNFSANVNNNFINNSQITVTTGKLLVNPVINFTNAGNILPFGVEVNATGVFTNEGTIASTSGDVNIKSASFTNGAEKEIFAKNMSIDSGAVTNAGILTATGDLLITATSITNFGKIEAQNGELETTEANILFGENSENTFTGKLVVTTATDFENKGTIKAVGFEVNATGIFTNEGTIASTSGDVNIKSARFTNGAEKEIFAKNMSIDSSAVQNAGNLKATGDLLITATSITNSGKIEAQNGELETTEANILFEENSENTFTGKLVITTETDFENNGIIIASEFEVNATTDFENKGTIEVTSGNFSANVNNNFINNSQITVTTGKLLVNPVINFTNAGNILAVGFEVNATGIFTNDGTIDSTSGDVKIKSARFTNGAEKEILAKNMSIDSGAVTNAGILTATGDFLVNATGVFTSQGKVEVGSELNIKSQNCTVENEVSAGTILLEVSTFESTGNLSSTGDLLITATSITNSGKIEAQNGELETTEANILFGENSENTFTGKLVITTETDFENNGIIIASEFEVNATTDFENKGTIEVTSGNFSANVNNNFINNSQITVTTGKLLVNPVINFTNAGNILAVGFEVNATGIFTNEGTIASKDISINSPTVNLAGTINAETNISISGNLYIIGESSISFGENFFVGTAEYPKDIYISALDSNNEAASVNFIPKTEIAKIQLSGNFALFNGNVSLGTELVVGKDMILLNGETSGENSIYKDSMTDFDLYKYHLDGRPVSCNLEAFPTEIPNNNNIKISHEEYKSTFTVEDEKTISVGKNFYSNGVNLGTDENQWTLKIPVNDVATSSFAECYNATITNCEVAANTSPGSAWLSTENCTDGTGNTNVAFSKAIFANVATISDNIIRVSFVDGNSPLDEKPEIKIENSCNEISAWVETDNFRFNISSELPEGVAFSGIFANPECTETTDGKGDLSTFYLKYEIPTDGSTDYRWNTDATGSDPGAEESTDYSRNHKNVVPNLLFKRAIEASYAGLRDEHKNRLVSVGTNTAGAEPLFEATKDEAPPVLIAVTLGQEQHETEATAQHHYDSHNFIEWQFSEPVEFENYPENGISQIDGVETSAESENIQSTTNFGKITNNENGFSVAGFGSFETGKVSLGSKTGSGEVNAFYRKFALVAGEEAIPQKNRIRLSIAGYVDKENPVVVNGVNYKNWLGFIDSKNTIIPSGTFRMPEEYSKSIKDLADNEGISPKDSIITNAIYSSMGQDLQTETLYGTWDIDPPVVANYMKETSSGIYAQELLAVNNTDGNTAESLEIHFLDNSAYNTLEGKNNLQWRTKIGWKENNVQITKTTPLDTKGGSRMTSDSNKTLGGLRFSTIIDSLDAFVCQNITTKEYIDLIESEAGFSQTTTNKNIFGESDVNQFDVPYLTLKFEDAKGSLLKHNYELKYNTEKGFITDLAGNLLYDFTVNSPDKNPPQFLLSIGGVNYDKLYILFSKPIDYLNQNNEPDEGKLRRIVKSLSVFESTSDGEKDTGLIDYKLGSKAKVVTKTNESTGIEISLTRKVSYDELKHLYIGVNTFDSTTTDEDADSSLGDPITGEPGEYSMLYDMFENPISEDSKHCFSDFAVNAFDVLYAYDGRAVEEAALAQGVFGGNQWTVTDFSGETNNSSKIIAGKDITIAGKIVDSSENPDEQDKFSMLADISPAKNKAGLDFKDYTDRKTRLWFPDFVKLFPVNNSSTSENFTTDNLVDNGKIETDIDGKDNNIFTYVIPNNKDDSQSVNWADGDEFEFLFKIYNSDNEVIMVDGNVDGDTDDEVDHPLFALRLKDENDITSIDLWSLQIVELVRQKGGTTILNNVINSLNNEETVVEVQVPQTGFLTVQVLTLDGNVVKVLQRGRVEEGTYYYKWNGTNISGAAVARGMYFVRVVGPNIDETRKVMVIKE